MSPARATLVLMVSAVLWSLLLATECGTDTTDHGGRPPAPSPSMTGEVLRYGFDTGIPSAGRPIEDETGSGYALRIVSTGPEPLVEVAHAGGRGIGFPEPCRTTGACRRAILEGPDADRLDPGNLPFRYGANVRISAGYVSRGGNVMQKGYSELGSQWKLQVDGERARPSCVVVGQDRVIRRAVAERSVNDGRWHTLECQRSGDTLRVLVDGREEARTSIPAGLTIRNSAPFRVGGNSLDDGSDQFRGAVDDLFFSLG